MDLFTGRFSIQSREARTCEPFPHFYHFGKPWSIFGRSQNWKSTWTEIDDVLQERENARTEKYAYLETASDLWAVKTSACHCVYALAVRILPLGLVTGCLSCLYCHS